LVSPDSAYSLASKAWALNNQYGESGVAINEWLLPLDRSIFAKYSDKAKIAAGLLSP
jgi:hypothetical protein